MIETYIGQITSCSALSRQEAIWLLEHIFKKNYLEILDNNLTSQQEQLLDQYIKDITQKQKPLAYIIGWVPFLQLKLNVRPPILIPRPETEEWTHQLIEKLDPYRGKIKKILDIGTGSGAIALSLAKHFADAKVWAIDINPDALKLAQENAIINAIENIEFIKSDLFEQISDQKFDLIVSNPPYIPKNMHNNLSLSVSKWEDPQALFSGQTGIDLIEKIIKQSKNHLYDKPDFPFQLVIEIDVSQHQIIQNITNKYLWNCTFAKDLFGNWRTIWCSKKR